MTAQRQVALHVRLSNWGSLAFILSVLLNMVALPQGGAVAEAQGTVGVQATGRVYLPVVSKALPMPIAPAGGKIVQQGLFYDAPHNTSITATAQNAKLLVLTRGKARYRDEVRRAGFRGKALQYFLSNEVAGPWTTPGSSCNSSYDPPNNQVATEIGDFCKYIHPNESWFLHNGRGERLVSRKGQGAYYHMNPGVPGWREFVRSRLARDFYGTNGQPKTGFDGFFLDNVAQRLYKLHNQVSNSDGRVREFSSDAQFRAAAVGYLATVGSSIRPNGVLWANLIDDAGVSAADYLPYVSQLDGYMNEAWALGYTNRPLSAERWNEVLSIAEATFKQGKSMLGVVQGSRDNSQRQQFGLASYLLVTNGNNGFFRYGDSADYHQWWQYDNYDIKLGAPKGPRYPTGSAWRRDFTCGYVTADPVNRTGKIVQTCK